MSTLTTLAVIGVVAVALAWKMRCIWRGCTIDPDTRRER